VTYTAPGQELTGLFGDAGNMPMTAGWYRSPHGIFHYLVDVGLPERNPGAPVATGGVAPDTPSRAQSAPWAKIAVVVVGLAALSLAVLEASVIVSSRGAVRRDCSKSNIWVSHRSAQNGAFMKPSGPTGGG
jgi:hypothetical protein